MIYLLLGTNMGDREANLTRARGMLEQQLGVVLTCSGVLETTAIGFEGPDFLNQVVAFEGDCEPYGLLHTCQRIERAMGRKKHKPVYDESGKRIYSSRLIDIDILKLNGMTVSEADLQIPHPQVGGRPFVKELLAQLETEHE